MKAVIYTRYGAPSVLKVEEIARPVPKDDEVLVRIYATAVNSGDVRLRKADPFAVRFLMGLTRPKINVLGAVFSGRVEAKGKNVSRYQVGDELFGSTDMKFGAYAEYKCFSVEAAMAEKPASVSHTEAAVIPFGGATALYFLKKARVGQGQKVLIYGASGAVGTAAVQLAKHFGAHVTAVCSTANVALLRSLGADRVIDYCRENIFDPGKTFDVIYDTVNKLHPGDCLRMLSNAGVLVLGAAGSSQMLSASIRTLFGKRRVIFGVTKQTSDDIGLLSELVQKGFLRPVIDRTFTLEQVVEAHAYVDQGHKKGNVAVTV